VPSYQGRFSADFIADIAESSFQNTQLVSMMTAREAFASANSGWTTRELKKDHDSA
jgi:hypothetical protein